MLSFVAIVVAATVAGACSTDRAGYCRDKVVSAKIRYPPKTTRVRINCALGEVVSISFPKEVTLSGTPVLGNAAPFQFEAQQEPFRILVWPRIPRGAKEVAPNDLMGARSNLQVFLDSDASGDDLDFKSFQFIVEYLSVRE